LSKVIVYELKSKTLLIMWSSWQPPWRGAMPHV